MTDDKQKASGVEQRNIRYSQLFHFFFLSVSIARHLKEQILECLIFQGRKFGLDHWPVAVGEFAILYSHYLLQLVPFSIMYSSPLWEIHVLQSTAVK